MNLPKAAFIILVPVLLSCGGCSTITFGYDHGDWVLRYWINGYTSFNSGQKEEIRNDIADYMRWHRKYALPEYTAFLQNLDASIARDSGINADEVMHARAEIGRLYKLTMTPFILPAAHILSTLNSQQTEELRKTLAEQNHEPKEEALSGSEQENLASRAKRHINLVEKLVGPLSGEQQAKVREMSLHLPFITRDYFEQREAKQASLIALLNNRASEEKIATLLRDWINPPESSISPQQQHTLEAYDRALNEMVVGIHALLTAQQKAFLRNKISTYIEAFQHLHSESETGKAALAH